jgi:superfamily II DNA/RNA helicase
MDMKFSELELHPLLKANLDKIGFSECTKIQDQAIPAIRLGKDVAGLAQTGTGKTGAFLIPLIDRMLKAMKPDDSVAASPTVAFTEWKKKQYILCLVPTRELAEQVFENAEKFLEGTDIKAVSVYGGTTYEKQVGALKAGVEFVIATPGRFIDLHKEHVADLGLVRAVVFDEADRMFDMGFKDDMIFLLKRIPRDRQFLVFSATLNFDVLNVAYEFGADPVEVNIGRDQAKADNVKDYFLHAGTEEKPKYLLSVLKKYNPRQAIIFSNFKHNVERLTKFLTSNGVPAVGISSLLTQAQRVRVMEQFKADNDRNILVATDVAARGLDILGVDMVINYDLPDDAENYVHRIGRTGRAGATGQAFSLVGERDVDAHMRIEEYLKNKIENLWLDDSELITDFKPVPRDESRNRFAKSGPGGGGRDRDRGPRPDRNAGGPGGGRDRGPRSGGGGRDRGPGGGGRDRDRDRGPRGPRPEGAQAANGERGPRQEHRDRNSGRHQGNGPREGGPNRDRDGQRPQGGPGGRDRGHGGGRPQHARGPNREGGRPQGQGGRPDHARRGNGGPGRQGGRPQPQHARGAKPGVAAAAPVGLGKKVSGFFKKLFGG